MALEIQIVEKEPLVYTITPKGEINTETYQIFTDKLKEVAAKATALMIDMAGVTYLSSMGLSAFFRLKVAVEGRGATIALVNMQPPVKLVFEATKFMAPQMFASLEAADEFLDKFLDNVQKGKIKLKIPPPK